MHAQQLIALSLVIACGGGEEPPPVDTRELVLEVRASRALDLLFVVDDSGGTADMQITVAEGFRSFVAQLALIPGGLPDLHVGVITGDLGTKASGSPTPAPPLPGVGGCMDTGKGGRLNATNAPVSGTFVSDVAQPDGTRARNYTGELADAFGVMVRVGASGCGFEQPLAAMRAGLGDNPANVGFLRPEALLAVVIAADEDDCSARDVALFSNDGGPLGPLRSFRCTRFGVTCDVGGTTPDEMNTPGAKAECHAAPEALLDHPAAFRDFLVELKGDEASVVVGGVFGTPEVAVELDGMSQPMLAHSCSFETAGGFQLVADPGVRLQEFVDLFGERGTTTSVCQTDFGSVFASLAGMLDRSLGGSCLRTPIANPRDCVVEERLRGTVTAIEPCDASELPTCWKLVDDSSCAASLRLEVVRTGTPDRATITQLRC